MIARTPFWNVHARKRPLIAMTLLAIGAIAVGSANASNVHNVQFGFGQQYDTGGTTSLGFNASHQLVEVHQSQSASTLWYSVGYTNLAGVYWGSTGIQYDNGITPKCALNDNGLVVEVHQSQGNAGLWYHVGTLSGGSVNWGGSRNYDSGANPAVAVNGAGTVVEVHKSQSDNTLWYHVGAVSGSTVNFGGSINYDGGGYTPSVALNNSGTVVEVHQSSSANTLWYRVGSVRGATITWGTSTYYTDGVNPSIALTEDGQVVETHASGSGAVWQNTGYISGTTIVWNSVPSQFDSGVSTAVAVSGNLAVQTTQYSNNALASSSSLLLDRASWMENALGTIGNHTLSQIAMPGSHDAGMYYNTIIYDLAQTQDMTIQQQLYAGVRYFDLRPHWTGSDLEIYHGPLYAESVQTVLNDVASFMQTNRRELVILKFSHYDNFDSAGVAYQTLTSWVQNTIGSWLYTGRPSGVRLANLTLNDYVAGSGKVLVVCDGSQPIDAPSPGVYVYRDWSSSDPQNGDLVVFDQYADVTDYSTMKTDQFTKFDDFTGYAQNNSSVPCDLFLLSWTLTPAVDVWSLVGTPDQDLGSDINTLSIPNSSGKIVNIVYTDYVEYSRSTDVAEYLNGIPY